MRFLLLDSSQAALGAGLAVATPLFIVGTGRDLSIFELHLYGTVVRTGRMSLRRKYGTGMQRSKDFCSLQN
jgi:hypothetical protein